MKQPNKNYSDFIFQGSEANQDLFRGRQVGANHWYVGTCNGTIEAGPYVNERHAEMAAEAMTNTVGT